MLRTQILQAMDTAGSKILAVTSPTPGCGKTVTAVNLALSIARQAGAIGAADGFGFPKATGRTPASVCHPIAACSTCCMNDRVSTEASLRVRVGNGNAGASDRLDLGFCRT